MIEISGLNVRYYGCSELALRDIALSVGPGESVLATGPSGCGKSTLALCLAGFIPHAIGAEMTGSIEVCGLDQRESSVYQIAQHVGLVQQDPEGQFCTMHVEDEVAFGPENLLCPPSVVMSRVERALSMAGASHLRNRKLTELSGGEKQKVALAAVLAMEPELLILDEPTAHLDPGATRQIIELVERMRETDAGLTLLILEHKPWRFRGAAHRMVRISKGSLLYDGPIAGANFETDVLHQLPGKRRTRPDLGERVLEVKGLWQGYGDRNVLRGLDLEVHRGEIVGLMGYNGSGKTTLLQAIMGLLKPSAGTILLNGADISGMPVSDRARRIGMIFQNPNHQLFTDRVWREVVIGPLCRGETEDECRPRATALIDRFGLSGYCKTHPLLLSFGQKRRLNLASVMVSNPSVLLLDEPFAGQDTARACDLVCMLDQLAAEGVGILVVGHDPDIMTRCCDRILFMREGEILIDAAAQKVGAELERIGEDDYIPGRF
jgi:energy-coupling factor transporter ATP-binding protein EcfA2